MDSAAPANQPGRHWANPWRHRQYGTSIIVVVARCVGLHHTTCNTRQNGTRQGHQGQLLPRAGAWTENGENEADGPAHQPQTDVNRPVGARDLAHPVEQGPGASMDTHHSSPPRQGPFTARRQGHVVSCFARSLCPRVYVNVGATTASTSLPSAEPMSSHARPVRVRVFVSVCSLAYSCMHSTQRLPCKFIDCRFILCDGPHILPKSVYVLPLSRRHDFIVFCQRLICSRYPLIFLVEGVEVHSLALTAVPELNRRI